MGRAVVDLAPGSVAVRWGYRLADPQRQDSRAELAAATNDLVYEALTDRPQDVEAIRAAAMCLAAADVSVQAVRAALVRLRAQSKAWFINAPDGACWARTPRRWPPE